MNIEQWPIDRPKPYEKNARKIPQSAIDKVAVSLKEFGWQQPIVVDKAGVIIAGHTRLLAAKKLGLKTVPVTVATDLTPAKVRQYRLMDNRSHEEASWDYELLALDIGELKALDVDLGLTGFDDGELNSILGLTEEETHASLSDRFGVPPFSVLDARQGYWQDRKRAWLALGIESELGRGGGTWRKSETGGPSDRQRNYKAR